MLCGPGLTWFGAAAAKTALKRKKVHENSLEQTSAQISMLENQIYSIESANINQETLLAMQNASNAMKKIRGNLTIDKVDKIMYVSRSPAPHGVPSTSRAILSFRSQYGMC
jgi:trans-2-enoyl-CoA reductase